MRRTSCALAAAIAMLVFAPGAGAATGANLTLVEGQQFSGKVVSFVACVTPSSATIDWGDGTTSPGTPDSNAGIGGIHTYAGAGSYTGTVSYSCSGTPQPSATFHATVQDASLSASGIAVSGTAGQPLTTVVAHIADANPSAVAAQLMAQIAWGDGTTTTGSVASSGSGGFDVTGSHTYAGSGSFTLTTSITDVGGSTATATSTASIAPGTTTTTTTTSTTTNSSTPRVVGIAPIGSPTAGRPIVLNAAVTGAATRIQWNLAGDARPEVACPGATTAVTFRTTPGPHLLTATAIGAGGAGSTLAMMIDVAPAPPLSAAQARIARRVAAALGRKAPVYTCASPGDFRVVSVGPNHIPTAVDSIQTRACVTPRTVVEGSLEFVGCLRRITTFDEIPAAERGIIFPVSKYSGANITIIGKRSLSANNARAIATANLVFQLSDVYVSTGAVKMNGLTLDPGPTAAVLVASQYDRLVSSDSGMAVGGVGLDGARSFMLNLAGSGGHIPLGSFARVAGGLADIAGFALDGNVKVTLDDSGGTFGLTIRVHLELPSFLRIGDVSAQGDVALRATNDEGLVIDSLQIGPIDADIGVLGIQGLQLNYTRANQEWAGQGKACVISGACLDMIPPNGGVVIRHGTLYRAEASYTPPPPGIELFAGVSLTRIGFGIGLDPTRVLANAALTAEGVLEIDGHLVMAFPSAAAPYTLDRAEVGDAFPADFYTRSYTTTLFAIGADAYFELPIAGRTKLGGAYLLYQYPGYVGLGGGIGAHFSGIVDIDGRVDGEFNFANGRFSVKGDVTACVAGVVCAGAIAAVSDHGAGGCVHIGTFLGAINIGGGLRFSPFKIYFWPFDGCRWSPFVDTGVHPARDGRAAAAGASIPVTIRRGSASRAIELDGIGGAPAVRVQTPGGTVLDSPAGPGLSLNRQVRIVRSTQHDITVVGLVHPVAGTYTITALPGSAAIRTVSQASDQPAARVSASVHGNGARRTLVYDIGRRTQQRVTFVEQAHGGSRIIGTVNGGGRGRLTFAPAPGLDHRTVIAQFELAGLPAESIKVAAFQPLSPRLGRVSALKLTRRGASLAVRWRAVPGATSYEVVSRLAFSGEHLAKTRRPAISLAHVARFDGGVISVRAVATLRAGKPTLGRIRGVGRAPTRLGLLPRLPRRR